MDKLVTRLRKHKAAFLPNFLGRGSSSKGACDGGQNKGKLQVRRTASGGGLFFERAKDEVGAAGLHITIPTFESTFT